PGPYHGEVSVTAEGSQTAEVPVDLTVHNFTLPATSSIPVTYGFDARALGKPNAHGHTDDDLARRYYVSALRHRISFHWGLNEAAPWKVRADGSVVVDFRAYDAEVGPFLDGTADRGGPAEGARWSAIDLRLPMRLEGPPRAAYARAVVDHLRSKGWLERTFHYTWDEPKPEDLAQLKDRATWMHQVVPEVPRLVTRHYDPALDG